MKQLLTFPRTVPTSVVIYFVIISDPAGEFQ